MTTPEYREGVGTIILDQLARTSGGAGEGRLRAMVAATSITTLVAGASIEVVPQHSIGVGFRFSGCKKWNGIEIYLDRGWDDCVARFYRMNLESAGTVLTLGQWVPGITAEGLAVIFREETGLDTHL